MYEVLPGAAGTGAERQLLPLRTESSATRRPSRPECAASGATLLMPWSARDQCASPSSKPGLGSGPVAVWATSVRHVNAEERSSRRFIVWPNIYQTEVRCEPLKGLSAFRLLA